MLITKTNPIGIDREIQRIQGGLHKHLVSAWNLTDPNVYHCHGRVYRNKREEGDYIAEVFDSNAATGGIDYKEVYWNDGLSAISFFHVSDKIENTKGESKVNASVIFFVNVAKLKPTITHRADEEVRQDVINFFQGANYTGYETGIDNVLREYPGTRKNALVAVVERQPVHCLRINLILTYQNC